MKHLLLLTLLITQAACNNLSAMNSDHFDSKEDGNTSSLLQEDATQRRKGDLLVLKSKLERLNDVSPLTLQVTCDKQPCNLFEGEAAWLKSALLACINSIEYDNTTFCSEEALINGIGTTTIDITRLKAISLFAHPEDTKMRILKELIIRKGEFKVVYGLKELDISPENKIKLVEGLYESLQMLESTSDRGYVLNLAKCGQFPTGLVLRKEEAPQEPLKIECTPSVTRPDAYTLLKRLLHPTNLIAMAVVGVACWHASKHVNSSDV